MTHLKKHWLKYLVALIVVIYVIVSIVKGEWNPLKWFGAGAGERLTVDTERCCHQHNPCGWPLTAYKRYCAGA